MPARPIKTQCLFVAEITAGGETKERETPPISLYPKPEDRIQGGKKQKTDKRDAGADCSFDLALSVDLIPRNRV
jgi:hypothetical protein